MTLGVIVAFGLYLCIQLTRILGVLIDINKKIPPKKLHDDKNKEG